MLNRVAGKRRGLNLVRATDDTLESAWAELLDAAPAGWTLGKPTFDPGVQCWLLYAFDQSERVQVGKRLRAWTAQHPTQIGVLREMAYCLVEISAGRVPK